MVDIEQYSREIYGLDMFSPAMAELLRLEHEKVSMLKDGDREVPMLQYILMDSRLKDIESMQETCLDFMYKLLADNFAGC